LVYTFSNYGLASNTPNYSPLASPEMSSSSFLNLKSTSMSKAASISKFTSHSKSISKGFSQTKTISSSLSPIPPSKAGPCVPKVSNFQNQFISTISCVKVMVILPFSITFNGNDLGGIKGGDGVGTGLTMVMPGDLGLQYLNPLQFYNKAVGLQIQTDAGLNSGKKDQLANCLGVGLNFQSNPNEGLQIETTLINIPVGSGAFEQAGILFGPTQANYVKITVQSFSTGQKVQALMSVAGVAVKTVNIPYTGTNVILGLLVQPATQTVSAYINNLGGVVATFTSIPQDWFSLDPTQLDLDVRTQSFACLFASHRNRNPSLGPLIYTFSDLLVDVNSLE